MKVPKIVLASLMTTITLSSVAQSTTEVQQAGQVAAACYGIISHSIIILELSNDQNSTLAILALKDAREQFVKASNAIQFSVTDFNNLAEQTMVFAIDPAKRTEVEIATKECLDMAIDISGTQGLK